MIAAGILGASMVADVVEDSQVATGRRSEGLFFAGMTFVQKAISGLGIFLVERAFSAWPGSRPAGRRRRAGRSGGGRRLVRLYLPTVVVIYGIAVLWLIGYRITRASHEASLELLAGSRRGPDRHARAMILDQPRRTPPMQSREIRLKSRPAGMPTRPTSSWPRSRSPRPAPARCR